MPSILDRDLNRRPMSQREAICAEALSWLKVPYRYGDKSGQPTDGAHGTTSPDRGIDCSGFVVSVYSKVFPGQGLDPDLHNTSGLSRSGLFAGTASPLPGDLVLWDGHVGIVLAPASGDFIGSQSSTGVYIASYSSGYWAAQPNRRFLRWFGLV